MTKRIHYLGASSIIQAHPEGGGKDRRTRLGALQIAAMNWDASPLPMFPLHTAYDESFRTVEDGFADEAKE